MDIRTYVRDATAMASTPADVKEYPTSYVFVVDTPGLKSGDIKVQVEDGKVLRISGERKRQEEKEGAKYVRRGRRVGKFKWEFVLPENANLGAISAVRQDGVLTVTVQKLPPPEPKTIKVKVVVMKAKVVVMEAKVVEAGKKVAKRNVVGKAAGEVAKEAKVVKIG